MAKTFFLALLLASLVLTGCTSQTKTPGTGQEGAVQQPQQQLQVPQEELSNVDSELSDLEKTFEDSSIEDVDFLELDNTTFQ